MTTPLNPTDKEIKDAAMTDRRGEYNGFAWSENGEGYSSDIFSTKQEALDDAKDECEAGRVYIGKVYQPSGLDWFPDADTIIEMVLENLNDSESGGEWSERWLETNEKARKFVSKADIDKLDTMLREAFGKWMDETGNRPDFYTVHEAEDVDIDRSQP